MFVEQKNGLDFELNKSNLTAKIIRSSKAAGDINIPRSIFYENEEYVITSISEKIFKNNRNIKSITFSMDSEIHSIGKEAFSFSFVENLTIPPSVEEFHEGWCSGANRLCNIYLSPGNRRFSYVDSKYLIWKSNSNNDEYDVLVFVTRKIIEAKVFSFIKRISASAFYGCNDLEIVDFTEDTNLNYIGNDTFSSSSITKIKIPSSVENFGDRIFDQCIKLKTVEFFQESKFKTITKEAFIRSSIERILIPSQVTTIEMRAFAFCKKLKTVEFTEISNIQTISKEAFYFSSIRNILIPSKICQICERAFFFCMDLKSIEILSESVSFGSMWIDHCSNLSLVSCPNLKKLTVEISSKSGLSKSFSLFVCAGVELVNG